MQAEVEAQAADIYKDSVLDWRDRLAHVVETMREMSRESDPQEVVRAYGARMRGVMATDGYMAISRRGLEYPRYRITRFSGWEGEINPWTQKDRLPILDGGLLGELIYGDEPRIVDQIELAEDDPGRPYLEGMGTLLAIPHYDGGTAPTWPCSSAASPPRSAPSSSPRSSGPATSSAGPSTTSSYRRSSRRPTTRSSASCASWPTSRGRCCRRRCRRSPGSTWRRTTGRRGTPAATTTTSSR